MAERFAPRIANVIYYQNRRVSTESTVYSTSLPSMHLSGEELTELEMRSKRIAQIHGFPLQLKIQILSKTLIQLRNFIEDFDISDTATKHEIYMRCDEGKVRIDAKRGILGGKVRISGETDWVLQNKRQINQFKKKNKIF